MQEKFKDFQILHGREEKVLSLIHIYRVRYRADRTPQQSRRNAKHLPGIGLYRHYGGSPQSAFYRQAEGPVSYTHLQSELTAEISALAKAVKSYEKHEKDADRFIALIAVSYTHLFRYRRT